MPKVETHYEKNSRRWAKPNGWKTFWQGPLGSVVAAIVLFMTFLFVVEWF